MPRKSILLFAAACLIAAGALAIAAIIVVSGREAQSPSVVSTGQPDIGGPFQLVDRSGEPVDESILRGRWSAVFFGFTWCPDYCPTTLQSLAATRSRLGDRADDLQIVFVSVDPERDTPAALDSYLSSDAFPEGVIGLTGSPAQVAAAADAYRAYYEKVGDGDDYLMNHSLSIYLMNPEGEFVMPLAHDLGPERMAALISGAMTRG